MRFKEKWDSIIEELKSKLNALVPADKITAGYVGVTPKTAPFILVFMEPLDEGRTLEGASKPKFEKALVSIVCGLQVGSDVKSAVSSAIELAHLAVEAVESLPGIKQKTKPEPDGILNSAALAFVQATANYETLKLADIQ